MMRSATVKRKTHETDVSVTVQLDGQGSADVRTGIGFLDHMLTLLASHSKIDLQVTAAGDLEVDGHHTTEDVGLALGAALCEALGERRGIVRYADVHVPMDEALLRCVLDFSGRPYLVFDVAFGAGRVGDFDTQLLEEFFRALAVQSKLTLHLSCLYGRNDHHIAEGLFKALARAIRSAIAIDPDFAGEIPSSKGTLTD